MKRAPWSLLAAVFAPVAAAYAWHLRHAEGFRFAYAPLLALVPLAGGLILWARTRRDARGAAVLRHPAASIIATLRRGPWGRLRDLPLVLRLLGVVLLGVAIARPQTTRADDRMELEGIDIVITLDLSGSMEEDDLPPFANRLEAAKAVIRAFIKRRPSDRIGLVVFGREAYTHAPLTLDHGTLANMLADLQLGVVDGRGTAIGNGLGVALNRLKKSDARSKVVILLTDGDNNAGNVEPIEAARFAQAMGVKVYTILVGSDVDGPAFGPRGSKHAVNPKLLEEIAGLTGGNPYLATDSKALEKRFLDILEELEKSRIADRAVLYSELFPRFLLPAFGVLLAEIALSLTRLRRLP